MFAEKTDSESSCLLFEKRKIDYLKNIFASLNPEPLFVILILPLARLMKNLKKGCGVQTKKYIF